MKKIVVKRMFLFFLCFLISFFVGLFFGFNIKKETIQFVEVEKVRVEVVYLKDEQQKEKTVEGKNENGNYVEMVATAYCSCEKCCGEWAKKRPIGEDGKPIVYTANGTVAKQGRTVAADPSVYPYGTVLVIDGNEYVVEDCGGAIKGENRVDVYFESHEDARQFGRKSVVAFVKG